MPLFIFFVLHFCSFFPWFLHLCIFLMVFCLHMYHYRYYNQNCKVVYHVFIYVSVSLFLCICSSIFFKSLFWDPSVRLFFLPHDTGCFISGRAGFFFVGAYGWLFQTSSCGTFFFFRPLHRPLALVACSCPQSSFLNCGWLSSILGQYHTSCSSYYPSSKPLPFLYYFCRLGI